MNDWKPLTTVEANRAGIYEILCNKTNRVYVGQSINIQTRLAQHVQNLNLTNHSNKALQNDWQQYGSGAFEYRIIRILPRYAHELLLIEEQKRIKQLLNEDIVLYNEFRRVIPKQESITDDTQNHLMETSGPAYKRPEEKNTPGQMLTTSCHDCGIIGEYSFGFYRCPDGNTRCEKCTDKFIWLINKDARNAGKQSKVEYKPGNRRWRWALSSFEDIRQIQVGISTFIQKTGLKPNTIIFNNEAPTITIPGFLVQRDKYTPLMCLDLMLPDTTND